MSDEQLGALGLQPGRWYVVQCKPLRERVAAERLRIDLQLGVYLAEVRQWVREAARSVPLFPGYLFVRADLGQVKLSSINATPGVLRLLDFGGGPQVVPDRVVEALVESVDCLNTAGGLPRHRFQPGARVVLIRGPLEGLEAVFVGPTPPQARVRVLLEFLGRLQEVQVPAGDLVPAGNVVPAGGVVVTHPPRRTRGRGRPIAAARPAPAD